jgi:hypothetical protein
MKRALKLTLVLAMVCLPVAHPALAGGGSGAHYKVGEGGKIEFYPDGSPKVIMGNVQCTGVKIKINMPAISHNAIQVPANAKISSFAMFEDPGFSKPLIVGGEPVVFEEDPAVAAMAARIVGAAKPGFVWVGYSSNGLLENVTGNLGSTGYWAYTFDNYPSRDEIGRHDVVVFTSDNAERVKPSVDITAVYEDLGPAGLKLPQRP